MDENVMEQVAEAIAEALLKPLQEVGGLLAKELDSLKKRVDAVERALSERGVL